VRKKRPPTADAARKLKSDMLPLSKESKNRIFLCPAPYAKFDVKFKLFYGE